MNFVKLFTDYKVDFNVRVNKGWTNVSCPFCDDKTFNGGFNNAENYFHCWKCGGHNFKQALSLVTGVPKQQVNQLVEQYQGRNAVLSKLNKKEAKGIKLTLPTSTFTKAERKYLEFRDFDPDLLQSKYKIVGGGIAGEWKYRIIIPLIYNNVVVSWTGRSILSKNMQKELKIPRYKNLSIEKSVVNPKSVFYNLDNCKKEIAVLTEGAFDVMRLGDDFFCSFGTELTQAQIKLMSERFKKIFIMFDNEKEAQVKARKFGLEIASTGVDVEVVDAYGDFNKNDGGELTKEEVKMIRQELNL